MSNCPACGSDGAYISLFGKVECRKVGCVNFTQKQFQEWSKDAHTAHLDFILEHKNNDLAPALIENFTGPDVIVNLLTPQTWSGNNQPGNFLYMFRRTDGASYFRMPMGDETQVYRTLGRHRNRERLPLSIDIEKFSKSTLSYRWFTQFTKDWTLNVQIKHQDPKAMAGKTVANSTFHFKPGDSLSLHYNVPDAYVMQVPPIPVQNT